MTASKLTCELCATSDFSEIRLRTDQGEAITPSLFACKSCSGVYFDRDAERPNLRPTLQMPSLATYGPGTPKQKP
jgi:hypothetical protein